MKGRISKEFQIILSSKDTRKQLRDIIDNKGGVGFIKMPDGRILKIRPALKQ